MESQTYVTQYTSPSTGTVTHIGTINVDTLRAITTRVSGTFVFICKQNNSYCTEFDVTHYSLMRCDAVSAVFQSANMTYWDQYRGQYCRQRTSTHPHHNSVPSIRSYRSTRNLRGNYHIARHDDTESKDTR